MKRMITLALALSLLGGTTMAQPNGRGNGNYNNNSNNGYNNNGPDRYDQYRTNPGVRMSQPRWSRGDRVPRHYRNRQYVVTDWQQRHMRRPPRGYNWVRDDSNNYFLAGIASGVILDMMLNGNR